MTNHVYLFEDNTSILAVFTYWHKGLKRMDLWAIFLTGLFTGGLSCLAVQGGLLATAITRPVTVGDDNPEKTSKGKRRRGQARKPSRTGVQVAKDPLPVLYFLGAKLLAYTI